MERRRCQRMALVLEIELIHSLRHVGRFRTHDVASDGLFLEVPWLGIIPKDLVELQWSFGATSALVVHRSAGGIGLMFREFSLAPHLPWGHNGYDWISRHEAYPEPRCENIRSP